VANVFFVLAGADTSDEIEAVERDVSPLLARHNNALYLNRTLYARLAALYTKRETLDLNAEQARVLERYHTRFVRAGAALEKPAQERLAAINERLASLGTQFGQNVLADEKSFVMLLDEGDLAGLPDFARAAARAAAEERGQPGKYAITLARSSIETFLQFSSRRDLREKAFEAWIGRGENGGATDNRAPIAKWLRCAPSGPGCWALLASPTTGSMISSPRLLRRRAGFSTRSGAGRARRPPPSGTPCRH
jgi:peptidyl-dipeptidase Dcp